MRPARALEAFLLLAFAAFATLLFLRPIWDIDVFWHVAAGEWILQHGTLPETDIFGVDPTRPWFTFQWAYEVLVALLERAGGFPALRVAHAAVMAATFALLYRVYRRELGVAGALVLWLFTLLLFQDRINVRPHIFNLLALAILLPALLGRWRTASKAALAGWAATFAVWANLHAGGCLLMLIAFAAIPLGATLEPERRDLRRAWGFWLVCAAVCLASPGFIRGTLHALALVQTTQDTIGEWNAPIAYLFVLDDPSPARVLAGLAPYVTLLALGAAVVTGRLRGRDPTTVGAMLALTALSVRYVRFIEYAAPVWVVLAPAVLSRMRAPMAPRARNAVAAAASVALVWLLWDTNVDRLYGGLERTIASARTDLDVRRFPVEAADLLEAAGFEGTIFCHARYGSYLVWRLAPRAKPLVDGRSNVDAETARDVLYVHEHHREADRSDEVAAIYDQYALDALVLEAPALGGGTLDCRRWLPALRTPKLEVYVRNDAKNAENLRRLGVMPGRCVEFTR